MARVAGSRQGVSDDPCFCPPRQRWPKRRLAFDEHDKFETKPQWILPPEQC
jgi:hypothetical protein